METRVLRRIKDGDEIDEPTYAALVARQERIALRVRREVAAYYGVPESRLLAHGRTALVAEARHVAAYLMRLGCHQPVRQMVTTRDAATGLASTRGLLRKQPYPYARIGALLERDHSTAMHSCQVVTRLRTERRDVAYAIDELIGILSGRTRPDRSPCGLDGRRGTGRNGADTCRAIVGGGSGWRR